MMAAFRLRIPPRKPKKGTRMVSQRVGSYPRMNLEQILDGFIQDAFRVNQGRAGYDYITKEWLLINLNKIRTTYSALELYFTESDEDYAPKLATYKKEVEEYQAWRKENAVEIAAYENKLAIAKAQREQAKKERLRKRKEAEKLKLIKQLETTQMKLTKMKAEESRTR